MSKTSAIHRTEKIIKCLFSVLEISTHDYGPHNERLVNKIANGLNTSYRMREEYADRNNSLAFAGKFILHKQPFIQLNTF